MFAPQTRLTANLIYGFTNAVLLNRFDDPKPTPQFHLELWDIVTRPDRKVAIAAPRGHAKSTAITHSYLLANILFKIKDYILIVSDTEGQAIQFLGDIKAELLENEELQQLFGFKRLIKDKEADIIGEFDDGSQFRIMAKGSEQKVRGLKWRNKRPNLIIGDDLENDEIVLNEERRFKFRQWFFNALIPAGSDDCHYRIVGTILHLDALLERLMPPIGDDMSVEEELRSYSLKKRAWLAVRYKAHNNDFSEILWPEKFPQERLESIRQDYIEQGFPEGYAQEYLNYPIDEENAYFRKSDFFAITDKQENLEYYAAADLAISEKDGRAYTAIVVVGRAPSGILKVVDVRRFRGDSLEIIEAFFSVHSRYKPEAFIVEQENIARSIGPFLYQEMGRRDIYINIEQTLATQDKVKRARSIQARMRAGQMEFNDEAHWFPELYQEMLHFPRGKYVDQVDALAHIGMFLDKMTDVPTIQELEDELYEEEYEENYLFFSSGRDAITGY